MSIGTRRIIDTLWVWLLVALLAFFNYLWFFERNFLDSSLVPMNDPWHQQAMTLTYLTIALCLLLNFLLRRSRHGLFSRDQLKSRTLWATIGIFFLIALSLIYNPWISPSFRTVPLEFIDWAYALAAAGMFVLIREFQRTEKEHNRKAMLELHRKHPKHRWHPHLHKD